jgi:predicted transcriptional regulator
MSSNQNHGTWTFLTNHAHVFLALAANPDARLREVAELVGITERAVFRIVDDLERDGYVAKKRVGRRNTYTINPDKPFRHPLEQRHQIRSLLSLVEVDPQSVGSARGLGRPATHADKRR